MSHLYSTFFRPIGYRTDLGQLRLMKGIKITDTKIIDTKKEAVCLLAVWDESQ